MSGIAGLSLGELTMLNIGECPSVGVESRLSWILEDRAPEKYYLSSVACLGILNRAARRGKELPFILQNALISMIVEGTEYGQEGIRDTVKILREMRSEIGTEALEEWVQRAVVLVQQEKVLLTDVCKSIKNPERSGEQELVTRDCKKEDDENILLNVRSNGEIGDTSQRPEPDEQLRKQFGLLVQKLPHKNAQEAVIMYCLRVACKGEEPVFKTLSANAERCFAYAETVALEGNGQRESHKGDGFKQTDKMYTLNTTEVHGVAYGVTTKGNGDAFATEERHTSLTSGGGQAGQGYPAVAYGETVGALCARDYKGVDEGKCILVSVPYTLQIRSGCDGGGKGALVQEDKVACITAAQTHTLFQPMCIGNGQVDQTGLHDKAGTLNCMHDQQAICYGICSYASNSMKSGNPDSGIYEADTSRTLDLNGGNPACNQGGVAVCEPHIFDASRRHSYEEFDGVCETVQAAYGTGGNNQPIVTEPAIYDMTHANDVIRDCGSTCPTLQNRMGTGGNQIPLTIQRFIRWIVRRLTPLECTRLQGYPDGWVDIGEWTDSKGKVHKDADSPKYKALGNSIALPFWLWMFKRMAKYLPDDATLGSLFDGIGGFPLCWERVHGKGTAVWASEIEEFPIAVTKIRFPELQSKE